MILNYHHHSTFIRRNGKVYVLSLHGKYLNQLALNIDKLNLFLFENLDSNSILEDYKLDNEKIEVFSLGPKYNLFVRTLFSRIYVKRINEIRCDVLLFRAPTPLLISNGYKSLLVPLVVGDYVEDLNSVSGKFIKKYLIISWIFWYDWRQRRLFKKLPLVLFNNHFLKNKYYSIVSKSKVVSTSLVTKDDLTIYKYVPKFERTLKVLYVGRIDNAKGIGEFIEAIPLINKQQNVDVNFNIVGWDPSKNEETLKQLERLVKKLNLEESVNYLGKLNHDEELFKQFRESDILYLGSKASEGFPRVLWEAMASKTPILCSRVGGIPRYVTDDDVYFLNDIEPTLIASAIIEMIRRPDLLYLKVNRAFELVKKYTLEENTKYLLKILSDEIM